MNRAQLLEQALDAVNRRPKTYGPPEQNFERIADLWTVYLRLRGAAATTEELLGLNPTDVAAMMVLMKVARLIETPDHEDSWADIAGYAACGVEVATGTRSDCTTPENSVKDQMLSGLSNMNVNVSSSTNV